MHPLTLVDESLTGNAVSAAWSRGSLGAVLMREGFRGPLRAHVLDASDGFRIVATFSVPNPARSGYALLAFPMGEDDVLVATDGFLTTRWNARTGARIVERVHVEPGRRDHVTPRGFLPDGRVLLSRVVRGENDRTDVCAADVATGSMSVEMPACTVDRIAALDDGEYVVAQRVLSRVAPGGEVRWRVDPPVAGFGPRHLVAHGAHFVAIETSGLAHCHDVATGELLGQYTLGNVMDVGFADDRLFVLLQGGEFRWVDAVTGASTGSTQLDRRSMRVTVSPEGTRALVLLDLLEFRSSVQAVTLRDGVVVMESGPSFAPVGAAFGQGAVWAAGQGGLVRVGIDDGSITRVHAKACSAVAIGEDTGTVGFIAGNRGFVVDPAAKTKPRALGFVRGEAMLAVADDGARAAILDDDTLRVLDIPSAKAVATFDPTGAAIAHVGRNRYALHPDGIRPIDGESTVRSARVAVGDAVITIVDAAGAVTGRIHLAADGKAAIVEDGERFDLLGPPAKARSVRTIQIEGRTVSGKRLDELRSPGLLRTLLAV